MSLPNIVNLDFTLTLPLIVLMNNDKIIENIFLYYQIQHVKVLSVKI